MKPFCKKQKHGQLNTADRLSALPDEIIYHIISFLGFKDACRTSILSKRWKYISDTNPVMELSNEVFSAVPDSTEALVGKLCASMMVKVNSFLKYIETRMKRYAEHKLQINKLTLGFPIWRLTFPETNVLLENKVEQWVKIAVHNQVAELVLSGPKKYILSDILFSAKSLRRLHCSYLKISDYKGIVLFPFLESLFFHEVNVNDSMLNRIISSCLLLKHFRLSGCNYASRKFIKTIVIPCNSKLKTLDISESISIAEGKVTIDTCTLTSFQYLGYYGYYDEHWPVISKDGYLRNLRRLIIGFVSITDKDLDKLLSELVLLETLKLYHCSMLRTIGISSALLKDVGFEYCSDLVDVSIDAPCLQTFVYKGDPFETSMCINALAVCEMSLHIPIFSFCTDSVWKLKKLLIGLGNCHVLKIVLLDVGDKDGCDIAFVEEELADACPCDITELKLNLSSWILHIQYLSPFLDNIFQTCHPCIVSFRVNLSTSDETIEPLIRKLKDMANSRKYPLKRVEVDGTNCSDLLEEAVLDVQLRLHW